MMVKATWILLYDFVVCTLVSHPAAQLFCAIFPSFEAGIANRISKTEY